MVSGINDLVNLNYLSGAKVRDVRPVILAQFRINRVQANHTIDKLRRVNRKTCVQSLRIY